MSDVPGVIKILDWFEGSESFFIVMEKFAGQVRTFSSLICIHAQLFSFQDLFDYISEQGPLKESAARDLFSQVWIYFPHQVPCLACSPAGPGDRPALPQPRRPAPRYQGWESVDRAENQAASAHRLWFWHLPHGWTIQWFWRWAGGILPTAVPLYSINGQCNVPEERSCGHAPRSRDVDPQYSLVPLATTRWSLDGSNTWDLSLMFSCHLNYVWTHFDTNLIWWNRLDQMNDSSWCQNVRVCQLKC